MNQIREDITGVILAGGQAKRMGGSDKGLVELAGTPMIEYVLNAIMSQVGKIIINANRSNKEYASYGHRIVPDATGDFAGPLAGIAAGITAAETDLVLTVPCDGPWLPDNLAARLYEGMQKENSLVSIAHDGERMQPVFALFRREILGEIHKFLDAGDRKLLLWMRQQNPALVDFSDHPEAFINVNTPEEKSRVERLLQQQ